MSCSLIISRADFRSRFRQFTGDEVFWKFVKAIQHNSWNDSFRLRFWQEKKINAFLEVNSDVSVTTEFVLESLNICELHEVELLRAEAPVTTGRIEFDRDQLLVREANFPHATIDIFPVDEDYPKDSCTYWVCSECDEAYRQHVEEFGED